MSSQILSSPLNMASMAEFGKCWNAAHSSNVISLLQCVHVRVCECWEWHALTEHPHTCWLVVNRREMWQSKIFSFTPQMWSHDFDGDLEKSKTDKVPTLSVPPPPHRDRGGCEGWKRCVWCCRDERLIHIKERKKNYIFSLKKKKKNLWRRSHTSHSHDLSPWQLSPPGWTNWNCLRLCVSIAFISCLKVNVPLNEIMHSVWVIWRRVPCLISSSPEDLKQKYIFHANTNTVNLGFQHPSWTH